MKKIKLIIELDKCDYIRIKQHCDFALGCNIPLGQKEIAQGKPLQEELEKIKADIVKTRDMIPDEGTFCLGVKTGNTNDLVILDKYIEESNNEML